jgi:hypothetical protein
MAGTPERSHRSLKIADDESSIVRSNIVMDHKREGPFKARRFSGGIAMKLGDLWSAMRRRSAGEPTGKCVAVLAAGIALALTTACGGNGTTDPSNLATFTGAYTITIGSTAYSVTASDYAYAGHREVIVGGGSALTCTVRLDFVYAKDGRPASEVSGVQIIGFGGPECPLLLAELTAATGAPAPKVVVRNGRNEIDDGVVSGTAGWPSSVQMTNVHWSLHAR